MRTGRRAEDVVGGLHARHPVAVGVVDRVLERPRSRRHRNDLGPQQTHARDVERLALGVDLAHVDRAVQPEQGGGGGSGDAVLAGTGLGDDAGLAEASGEQRLTQHVVDLVRSRVVEVLALEEHPCSARVLGESGDLGERRGAPGVRAQQRCQLVSEGRIDDRVGVGRGELVDRGDQGLGHVPPAVVAEQWAVLVSQAHHASRKLLSVATGSPVTSASPIRTTSAPAER